MSNDDPTWMGNGGRRGGFSKAEILAIKNLVNQRRRELVKPKEGSALKFCKECGGELPCRTIGCHTCTGRNSNAS